MRMQSKSEAERSLGASVRTILRLEGLVVLALSVVAYVHIGSGWLFFAVLLLAPDLSMLGYFAGDRAGAFSYNLVHSYVVPLTMGMVGLFGDSALAVSVALIWTAHIGMDRTFGYGLKLGAFKQTHLGPIGRKHR